MGFTAQHLFYDDLEVAKVWESPGRTVTEADIVTFAGFSGDFNPIHVNQHFASQTPFRRVIVHGFGVFSIASGLGLSAPPARTIALVGVRTWKFALPVYPGDTIYVKSWVVEKSIKGRGKRGEVVWHRSIVNQDGKIVQEGEIVTLVECRPIEKASAEAPAIEEKVS
jgi:3-hydroxybutyryl-CoA dehydratase